MIVMEMSMTGAFRHIEVTTKTKLRPMPPTLSTASHRRTTLPSVIPAQAGIQFRALSSSVAAESKTRNLGCSE